VLVSLFTLLVLAIGIFSVLTLQEKISFIIAIILLVLFGVIV